MEAFVIIFFLLLFSAGFSSFETALFSIRPDEQKRLQGAGGVSSFIARVLGNRPAALTTVLLGNEVVNVTIAILAGSAAYFFMEGHDPRYVTLVTVATTTMAVLVFGEIIPKNFAVRFPVVAAQVFVIPYLAFAYVATPLRISLHKVAEWLVRLLGGDFRKSRRLIVEEELRDLLEVGKKEGTFPRLERSLIQNTLDYYDVKVREAMVPRDQVVAVSLRSSCRDILSLLETRRLSRLPVYEEDLDFVIGILHVKELLAQDPDDTLSGGLREHLKPFTVVGPDEILENLFRDFQKKKLHMAIVKEMGGQTIGVITLDDIVRRMFLS